MAKKRKPSRQTTSTKPSRYLKRSKTSLPPGPNGRAMCRWCGVVECMPPRRTFCSEECVHEYKMRSSGSYIREQIYKRDRGCCALCGEDTTLIAKELNKIRKASGEAVMRIRAAELGVPAHRKVWLRKLGGGLFDVDHEIPVALGGGQSGETNLRTLCFACHAEESAKLMTMLRKKR